MRKSVLFLLPLLGACTTVPASGPSVPPVSRPGASPPPQEVRVAPSTQGFRAPRVMNVPGLEGVIGSNETALANLFGPPRLSVTEGDAKKLQFTGEACVLDVYLYPLEPRGEPSATYVDARRASDGLDVDRAACVAALKR
ncbi:hypothetical protein [Erythrobacter sp. AP23]|uniref:hypothetical protein n=1 Tax=Erythrobacter sp. AP23 TaxID=499656 RepID=UPI00076CF85B|nr:hypothetical protein [Erythrobacter sp. AP23]KWV94883.1 hypothetical protein ASS64_06690 [Erythrobacter sp. AP23]